MKLRDLLNQLKYQITPNKEELRANIINNYYNKQRSFRKRLITILAGCFVALVIVGTLSLYLVNYFTFDASRNIIGDTAQISKIVYVAADKQESDGSTALQSTITLVTSEKMSVAELENHLSVTPAIPYVVRKTGINRFNLQFQESLLPDRSYTLQSLVSGSVVYRWSMQTATDFSVVETSPSDKDFDVSVDSDITITFSQSDVNTLQSYFSIHPATNGSFIHNGRTWIFHPEKPLSPYTTYTVTIASEIGESEGHTLASDYTFSFTTGLSDTRYAYVSNKAFDIADHFTTTEKPSIEINAKGMASNVADIQVYKLPSAESYLNLHKKYCQTPLISSMVESEIKGGDMALYSQFSITAISDPEQQEKFHFRYPKEHEKGYYLSVIQWEDIKLYQLMQVHEYVAYATVHQNQYCVWVNHTDNTTSVTGATVNINGQNSQTDENGTATIALSSIPTSVGTYITISTENTIPYYLYIKNDHTNSIYTDYHSLLNVDKKTYRPTDTIKVWGAVLKRHGEASDAVAKLKTDWNNQEYTLALNKDGAFESYIPLKNVGFTTSSLTLMVNGKDCISIPVTVSNTESTYTLNANLSKNAYFNGETVNLYSSANYTDNIPVKDLTVKYGEATAQTNENGKADLSVPAVYVASATSNCAPYMQTTAFESSLSKTQNTKDNIKHLVFNSKEFLQGEYAISDKQATLRIQTNQISLDKINAMSASDFNNIIDNIPTELYLGAPIHKDITVEIHNVSYERDKIGNYYDPIQQKILLKYKYNEIDTIVETLSVSTTVSDGTVIMDKLPLPKTDGYRYVVLKMLDSDGIECKQKIFVDQPISETDKYRFQTDHAQPKVNQTFNLSVVDASTKQQIKQGKFICHIVNAQGITSHVSSENIALSFSDAYTPEAAIFGAYFDGKHVHEITPQHFKLVSESKQLKISVTSEYLSDRKAKLNVQITDALGNPISASFNLRTTHGFIYTLENQSKFKLSKKLSSTLSNTEDENSAVAQVQAADCVNFISNATDTDGFATIEIELPFASAPLNMFVEAVTSDGKIGSAKSQISIQKETYIFCNKFEKVKSTEDISLAFGVVAPKLADDQSIESKISIYKGEEVVNEKVVAHPKNTTQYVNLAKLPAGNYRISISSTCSVGADEISFEFEVIDPLPLTNLSEFAAENNVSGILITDATYQNLHTFIKHSLQNANARIDWYLAYQIANSTILGTDYNSQDLFEKYLEQNGLTVYADSEAKDLLLNARLASLFPEQFTTSVGVSYFDNILKQSDTTLTDTLYALWGKAALRQAVEKDLKYYFAEGNGFTTEQYLCFALAYAYGGNQTKANEIYSTYLKKELNTVDNVSSIVVDDEGMAQRCNAMLAQLSARLSSSDTDAILQYAIANDSDTALAGLSVAGYLKEYVPALEGQNTVTITYNDQSTQVYSFDRSSALWLHFDAVANDISLIEQTEGASTVTAINNVQQATDATAQGVTVTVPRTSVIGEQISLHVALGTAKVQRIRLTLPTGLRYLGQYSASQKDVFITDRGDFIEIFTAGKDLTEITLKCKAVAVGNFSVSAICEAAESEFINAKTDLPVDIFWPTIPEPEAVTENDAVAEPAPQE